jgi:hypothetical protein
LIDERLKKFVSASWRWWLFGRGGGQSGYHPVKARTRSNAILGSWDENGYTATAYWSKYGHMHHILLVCQALRKFQGGTTTPAQSAGALDANRTTPAISARTALFKSRDVRRTPWTAKTVDALPTPGGRREQIRTNAKRGCSKTL